MKTLKTICYLTFFAIILLGNSCKKDQSLPMPIQGAVQDITTGQGVPNAWVILYEDTTGGYLFSSSADQYPIAQTLTNSKGEFYFKVIPPAEFVLYMLGSGHEQYFEKNSWLTGEEFTDVDMNKKKTEYLPTTIKLQPKGYLEIHVKNINNIYKRIGVDVDGLNIPSGGGGGEHFDGFDVDTIASWYSSIWGNYHHEILSSFEDNSGNYINLRDTIYLPAFDTTKYEILY